MSSGGVISSNIVFSGASVAMDGGGIPYKDVMASLSEVCTKDVPVIVVDVKGLQRRDIIPDILRKVKTKRELWLMTGIRNPGDVMDAFHGNMDKLVVPYHLTTDAHLKEMTELSDSCIPALFVDDDGVIMKGKRMDIGETVRALEKMHFRKILAFDVSPGGGTGKWDPVKDIADVLIPSCSAADRDTMHGTGFADVIVPAADLI
jgi:hypothetical protein